MVEEVELDQGIDAPVGADPIDQPVGIGIGHKASGIAAANEEIGQRLGEEIRPFAIAVPRLAVHLEHRVGLVKRHFAVAPYVAAPVHQLLV